MKKFSFLHMAILLVAGAALVACSEKNLNVVEEIPEFTYSVSVDATKGEGADTVASTRALSLDGSTLNAGWLTTENVYVKKGSTWASSGTLKPQANGTSAILKGSVTVTGSPIVATDELFLQFPKSGDPDYTGQKGTIADIAANFDYATATVTVDEVNGETGILTTTAADFVNQQAIVKFNLLHYDGTPVAASSLTVNDAIDVTPASASNVLYVAMPGFAEGESLALSATDNNSRAYSFSKASFPQAVENGKYYEFNIKFKPVINVTTASPIYVVEAGANDSEISYAIANVAAGEKVSASANVAWISNIDCSTAGTVSFDVTGQTHGDAARTGVITLTYPGANDVTFYVSQEGKVYTLSGTTNNATQGGITWAGDFTVGTNWQTTVPGTKTASGGQDKAIYSTVALSNDITKIEVTSGDRNQLTINSLTITAHSSSSDASSGSNAFSGSTSSGSTAADGVYVLSKTNHQNQWIGDYYRIMYHITSTANNKNGTLLFTSAVFYGYIVTFN